MFHVFLFVSNYAKELKKWKKRDIYDGEFGYNNGFCHPVLIVLNKVVDERELSIKTKWQLPFLNKCVTKNKLNFSIKNQLYWTSPAIQSYLFYSFAYSSIVVKFLPTEN